MPANTLPIFSLAPDIQWGSTDGNAGAAGPLKTANTAMDGTGTVLTIFAADATNGGRIEMLLIKPAGTNVATVLRVFINNGSANTVIANNTLIDEVTIPATTASNAASQVDVVMNLNLPLPPGYKINVAIGTTVAGGLQITGIGSKY